MKESKNNCVAVLSFIVGAGLSICAIVGGLMMVSYSYTADLQEYNKTTCILTESKISVYDNEQYCARKSFVPVWKVSTERENIYAATLDPITLYDDPSDAQKKLNLYSLNKSMSCYCNSNERIGKNVYPNFYAAYGCTILTYCFIDVSAVEGLTSDYYYYHQGSMLLMISGIILFSLFCIFIIYSAILCICECWSPCHRTYTTV